MKLTQFFGVVMTSFLSLISTGTTKDANSYVQNSMIKKGEQDMSNAIQKEADQPSVEIAPGLYYQQIEPGNGKKAKAGDTVAVHYAGTLKDGSEFDNSYKRGEPIKFTLGSGQVIKGWDLGVAELSVGEKGVLTISPEYGYGAQGAGNVIPGDATLTFEVELVSIN